MIEKFIYWLKKKALVFGFENNVKNIFLKVNYNDKDKNGEIKFILADDTAICAKIDNAKSDVESVKEINK